MFFERTLYADLISWAQESNLALYLEGPRQVGKTELLKKLGREGFKHCVYIDVRLEAERFVSLMEQQRRAFGRTAFPEEMGEVWEGVFRGFDSSYTNDRHTLVILDEIQESPIIYNSIRYIRRGLKSKLAVSGSYLGIVTQSKDYWLATGDLDIRELSSLTFTEFLKANGIWDEYDAIATFDLSKMTDSEKATCEQVRELYKIYCQIGGYPPVVEAWVENRDADACKRMSALILQLLYRESSSYFGDVIGSGLWSRTLERLAADITTKTGELDITLAREEFRDEGSRGLEIRRKDKVNALKWLDDCKIIGVVQVYSKLNKVAVPGNKNLFFFRDMGMLARLCKDSFLIAPSDIAGMLAENFTYLQLLDMLGPIFAGSQVWSYNGSLGQIDFVMHNENHRRFGIEVKHGSGGTKSGDKALAEGKIDCLVRIQDTYGSVSDNQLTIPIFMLDKLRLIYPLN
ncbi:MAG: AAA family ATPase [Defluviitaleaceae bacterium]|nr:AAA family ATPase [Defluviitaleaceae bacterium]MCL2238949.1 AAA family ATPase [Defluviitaleaceae bacterium]